MKWELNEMLAFTLLAMGIAYLVIKVESEERRWNEGQLAELKPYQKQVKEVRAELEEIKKELRK